MNERKGPQRPPLPFGTMVGSLRPEDVRFAAALSCEALASLTEGDWTCPAGGLDWTCRQTLVHLSRALDWYSLNLSHPLPARIPFGATPRPQGSVDEILAVVVRRCAILAALADSAAPSSRGHHIWGDADPAGFVAMACAEVLLHTDDIVRGLRATFEPPDAICHRVLQRLFPWAPAEVDGWAGLRWATGRLELPGYGRVSADWAWHVPPLAEWDGLVKTRASFAERSTRGDDPATPAQTGDAVTVTAAGKDAPHGVA